MVDVIDVPKLYRKILADNYRWSLPLEREGFWFSKDYYKETMDMFNQPSCGMKIVFVTFTPPQK